MADVVYNEPAAFVMLPGSERMFDDIEIPRNVGGSMTLTAALGYEPMEFDGVTFHIRKPRINQIIEIEQSRKLLSEMTDEERAQPECLLKSLQIVLPVLRIFDPVLRKFRPVTLEEAGDVMGEDDIMAVFAVLYPTVNPDAELEAAGLPNEPAPEAAPAKKTKTGASSSHS